MTEMRFGVAIPTGMEGLMYPIPFCDHTDLVEISVLAEKLGFDSVGGNDHIITQEYVREEWSQQPRYYDVFNSLSYIAARTSEIKLNTAVTVLPLRDPVWVAKQATTLDRFSDGRLLLGVGVGAYREEFDAVHPATDLPRGQIMDESIAALSSLSSGGAVSYDGEHVQFEEVNLNPTPIHDAFPIYIGGNHPNALKRAVRYGHGWLPSGLSPADLENRRENLESLCATHDRTPEDIDIAPQVVACIDESNADAREKFRESQVFKHIISLTDSTMKDQSLTLDNIIEAELVGSPASIIDQINEYRDVGITHLPAIIFVADTIPELRTSMELFADEVMPAFE